MNLNCLAAMGAAVLMVPGCTSPESRQGGVVPAAVELPQPNVVMEADPPPPFTYWAPEGAAIRNHPRIGGIWIAQRDGEHDRYYNGDQCLASRYQQFVGRTLDEMPEAPEGAHWRMSCSTCEITSDLRQGRLNVTYDEDTRAVVSIACG